MIVRFARSRGNCIKGLSLPSKIDRPYLIDIHPSLSPFSTSSASRDVTNSKSQTPQFKNKNNNFPKRQNSSENQQRQKFQDQNWQSNSYRRPNTNLTNQFTPRPIQFRPGGYKSSDNYQQRPERKHNWVNRPQNQQGPYNQRNRPNGFGKTQPSNQSQKRERAPLTAASEQSTVSLMGPDAEAVIDEKPSRMVNRHRVKKDELRQAEATTPKAKDEKRPVPRKAFKERITRIRQSGSLDTLEEEAWALEEEDDLELSKRRKAKKPKLIREVLLPEAISISNLAQVLSVPNDRLIRRAKPLLGLTDISSDYVLTAELASLLASEVTPKIKTIIPSTEENIESAFLKVREPPTPDIYSNWPLRAPVVTIMGHVDHGKTTLLDALRSSSIAAGEAGGITQHIGAFEVSLPSNQKITFLDTPGHAAFENIRSRGAQVTDIVVLVVAADDGLKPQTIEAIKHAHNAEVPMIVAINKIDKVGSDIDKVKQDLMQYGVIAEDFGGDTQVVEISALKKTGLDKLEEAIVTLSEVLDIRGDAEGPIDGVVLESQVQKGKGNVATVLVKHGTVSPGDILVAGSTWCKVKSMYNDHGQLVKKVSPSMPVEVLGWKDLPGAGEKVRQVESENGAKQYITALSRSLQRTKELQNIDNINQKRISEKIEFTKEKKLHGGNTSFVVARKAIAEANLQADQNAKVVPCIVKGDVSGSVEAVTTALTNIPSSQIRLNIISSSPGAVSESDIDLATTTNGIIIAFNSKPPSKIQSLANHRSVKIFHHNIIYHLLSNVKEYLSSLLPPEYKEVTLGEAVVAMVFKINVKSKPGDKGKGKDSGGQNEEFVAGCKVLEGKIPRLMEMLGF